MQNGLLELGEDRVILGMEQISWQSTDRVMAEILYLGPVTYRV